MLKNILLAGMVILVVVGGYVYYQKTKVETGVPVVNNRTLISEVDYLCGSDKSIQAVYYNDDSIVTEVAAGEPPVPTGSVDIALSDGRILKLMQTLSADGGRYSDGNPQVVDSESFVFWSKGNGALVYENGEIKDYTNCISVKASSSTDTAVYHDGGNGFTVRYPKSWKADNTYTYDGLGPDATVISGVKFYVPVSVASGTNLSHYDTGVSIETMATSSLCAADTFLLSQGDNEEVVLEGVDYSVASSTEGAAGNFYEQHVFVPTGVTKCLAIRYFIHSSNIANYPEGQVTEFDRQTLLQSFDEIRDSLVLGNK